jgi:hypothetical protein
MSTEDILKLVVPIVSGIISIIAAAWAARLSRATQKQLANQQHEYNKQLAELKGEHDREIQRLNASLSDENAEKKALRDYQYEARKRLYQECEPLLFQLMERSEDALSRIRNLAQAARMGNLGIGGWLDRDNSYYQLSTFYRFFSPLVFYILLSKRMTSIDLSLDARIKAYYELAKVLYVSFGEHFELARIEPKIEYDPNTAPSNLLEESNVSKYYRQGLNRNQIDSVVEALIIYDKNIGKERCKSFSEFVDDYTNPALDVCQKFDKVRLMFTDFHHKTKPVLWRLLIVQAHLYYAFLDPANSEHFGSTGSKELQVKSISDNERLKFYWLPKDEVDAEQKELLVEPFKVVEEYLARRYAITCQPASSLIEVELAE